jgi:two-component system, sensor histidine kinase and response regulator
MHGMDGIELAKRIRSDTRLAAMRLIMLTARDTYESNFDTVQLFAAILVKPLRRSQLLNCVMRAMTVAPEANLEEPAIRAVPPATARAFVPKVLLVEDDPVNREVAVGMLETLGCVAHAAENGRLALEAINNHAYDAVLMDCNMPVMDGPTATADLRRREQDAGAARLPIIALTVNAVEADRERYLAAGMDDFLTKPFSQQQLAAVLKRWLALHLLPESGSREGSRLPLIDAGVLRNIASLARPALLDSMIELYLQHSPPLIAAIELAGASGQAEVLQQALHTFKSSTANLGGLRLAILIKECEALVREGGIPKAALKLQRIRREYQDFCGALNQERSESAA